MNESELREYIRELRDLIKALSGENDRLKERLGEKKFAKILPFKVVQGGASPQR